MTASKAKFVHVLLAFIIAAAFLGISKGVASVHPQSVSGSVSLDPGFRPRTGTYYYKLKLNDLSIGNAWIAIYREGDLYKMQLHARTNKAIDRIYKVRYSGENLMDGDLTSPVETRTWQRAKSTSKDIVILFQNHGLILATEKKQKKGEDAENEAREVRTDRYTIDPLSATYLVRGMDWKSGDEHVFDIFTGKNRYEWRLLCTGDKTLEVGGEKRDAWVIDAQSRKIEEKPSDDPGKPVKVRLFVSKDELKDVLKVETHRGRGTLSAELERSKPAAGPYVSVG